MLRTVSLFLLIFVACVSCQTSPHGKVAQELRLNIGANPPTVDPGKARDLLSINLIHMLFEGLTRLDANEKPQLALATFLEISEDMKTYTFTLRKTRWSSGEHLTADDFVYAWRRVLNPAFPSDYANQLYVIKNGRAVKEGKVALEDLGVKAVDPLTLQVELETPTPYFLELLTFPVFFPISEELDRKNPHWAEKSDTFVNNGPFSLKHWRHEDEIILGKNQWYWDDKSVFLEKVSMCMVENDTELRMYEKGELDWAGSPFTSIPPEALQDLQRKGVVKTRSFSGSYFLRVNTTHDHLKRASFRKALSSATNRSAITDQVLQGGESPAIGLVPAKLGLHEVPRRLEEDIVKARSLFEASTDNQNVVLTLIYPKCDQNHLVVQVLQEQWRKSLGIQLKLEALDKKVFFSRLSKMDYELALCRWLADFNDPINFLDILKTKRVGTNNTGWENAAYTKLLERSFSCPERNDRFAVLAKAEKIMLDEMPIIPLYDANMLYLHREHVKDVSISSMGYMNLKRAFIAYD